MFTIKLRHGIYFAQKDGVPLGQARSLETLLRNITTAGAFPDETYFHAAEILAPLVRDLGGQISTGGESA